MTDAFYPCHLAREAQYAAAITDTALPFLQRIRVEKPVPAGGGTLFTALHPCENPRATVVIVHGFTSTVAKYTELIYSLVKNGYAVLAYEQRGHGRSWRPDGGNDLSLTHVDRFEDYVEDLGAVLAAWGKELPQPLLLFSHSMGGAESSLYMMGHPGVFRRAVLASPMLAPSTGTVPAWATLAICRGAAMLGRRNKRMFISKPYSGPEDFATSCATSRARFDWYESMKGQYPALTNNGPTYGWTEEAVRVTSKLLAPGAVEKLTLPVRVFSASEDTVVLIPRQKECAARLPQGELVTVKGAKHEIFRSEDSVMVPWWESVLGFLGT